MWKLKFNLKIYLSTAALPGQTTKTAQKAETRTPKSYLMQDWVFRLGSTTFDPEVGHILQILIY